MSFFDFHNRMCYHVRALNIIYHILNIPNLFRPSYGRKRSGLIIRLVWYIGTTFWFARRHLTY